MKNIYGRILPLLMAATCGFALTSPGAASAQTSVRYDLPSQDLGIALRRVGEIAGVEIMFVPAEVTGKTAPRLQGTFTLTQALDRLLAGTGLAADYGDGAVIVRGRSGASVQEITGVPAPQSAKDADDIVVTGSRIRGAPIASPVLTLTRESVKDTGLSSLGDVARSIPQSFGGGQNIGVGLNVPSENGANVGGGSSVNLRGLGSDATLTLLNGRRLPYSAARQSVDVSAIPLNAVDRIEVIADGSSALYGSDAVAGVVNILLRRDFDGLETSAQLGASTDDGNFQQTYGAIGGSRWSGGGAFAAYEFNRATAIVAEDRSYTARRSRGLTLFPGVKRHNLVVSAHQRIGSGVTFEVDGLFNSRESGLNYALNAAGDFSISRGFQSTNATSFAVAPRLGFNLAGDWRAALVMTYGNDEVDYAAANIVGGRVVSSSSGCYCNTGISAEIGGDGTVFGLAGQPVKLAVGAGYRGNDYDSFRGAGDLQNIKQSQRIYFGYGEISIPLISPDQESSLGHRLNITGAARYEHYDGIGGVATPKFGLIYAPTGDIDLKASWGQSFRAPTFIQQFQFQQAIALPVTRFGGSGYPAGATAVALIGGNPDLDPETADSLSVTLALHPRTLPGLRVEASYFSTRYIDRIVNPVTLTAQALSNPIFQEYVTLSPSLEQVRDLVAAADLFTNGTGAPFDPARVAAIVNSLNVNAGRQTVEGIDLLIDWRSSLGNGELGLQVNGAYLDSKRQLSPRSAVQQLAGTIFNPPHIRTRGTASWQTSALTFAATISHIGSIDDIRFAQTTRIPGMTMLDLAMRYRISGATMLDDTELALAALNVLNEAPAPIATTFFTDTPYDSTNYSAVGRFISLTLTKRW